MPLAGFEPAPAWFSTTPLYQLEYKGAVQLITHDSPLTTHLQPCPGSDSNAYLRGLKPRASADWATRACTCALAAGFEPALTEVNGLPLYQAELREQTFGNS